MQHYTRHEGIWFSYLGATNEWRLSDTEQDVIAHIGIYDGSKLRLDECIQRFKEYLSETTQVTL